MKLNGHFKEMRCNLTEHNPDVSYSAVSCSPWATLRALMVDDTGVYEITALSFSKRQSKPSSTYMTSALCVSSCVCVCVCVRACVRRRARARV